MIRPGTWWIYSATDPRWKAEGRGQVGGFLKPDGVDEAIEKLKLLYGKPPDDLTWEYFKD